jgi:hypothetical protein
VDQNYAALADLKNDASRKASLDVSAYSDADGIIRVTVQLNDGGLAFFMRLALVGADGNVLAPVHYSDNMFTLIGDGSSVQIDIDPRDLPQALQGESRTEDVQLRASGWNADEIMVDIAPNPSSSDSSGLSTGATVGIVVGAAAAVAVLGGGAYAYKQKQNKEDGEGDSAKDKLINDATAY